MTARLYKYGRIVEEVSIPVFQPKMYTFIKLQWTIADLIKDYNDDRRLYLKAVFKFDKFADENKDTADYEFDYFEHCS